MFDTLSDPAWVAQVAAAPPAAFWTGTVIVVLFASLGFGGAFLFLHRVRIVEDTPSSKIRSAAQGYVELVGRGELMKGLPIVAPLSGKRCLWYSYAIQERTRAGDGGGRRSLWQTVDSGTSDDLFLLVDDTGECVIDPEGATVTPSVREVWYGDSPAWSYGLNSATGSFAWLFPTGRFRYTEKRIELADPLYAIGLFRTVGGSQELPHTREEVRQLINLWKQDYPNLLQRFDRNGDGQLDLAEWEGVRKAAHREVLEAQRERARGPVTHIMTRPENTRRHYLLSVVPQESLVRRFRYLAAGSLAVFMAGGGLAAWLVSARLAF